MPTVPYGVCHSNALLAAAWVPVVEPASPNAARILHLFVAVFLICVAIFVVVVTLICISIVRFRATNSSLPRQDFGSHRAEIVWTIPPGVIVLGLGLYSARLILSITAVPSMAAPAGDADLVVVGHQWWWEVRYPSSRAVTANEIHVPVGRRLRVELESADVIHSFWVPQLAPKVDMIPGHPNFVWMEADREGVYDGACSEFCGDQHAWMRFIVVGETEPEYEHWLARQSQPAAEPPDALAQMGKQFFFAQTCVNCHAIGGTRAVADAGPDLTHLATRRQLAAGVITNTPENLAQWLRNPQLIKPGCKMPNFGLDEDQLKQMTAYLEGLR
jgi:cytochrome c oxidase subunit II